MSRSLNSVNITGHLGADPKIHTFDDGTTVANLRVAVARTKTDGSGGYIDDTVWCDVKVFGAQSKAIGDYLTKGSFVGVTGQLAPLRTWSDASGETRSSIVIDHATVVFGPKSEAAAGAAEKPSAGVSAGDADIPF